MVVHLKKPWRTPLPAFRLLHGKWTYISFLPDPGRCTVLRFEILQLHIPQCRKYLYINTSHNMFTMIQILISLSAMSHLRFSRASAWLCRARKSRSLRLSSCMLRLCRINKPNKMASSDSDDDIIACSLHLMTTIMNKKQKLNERAQKRKIWQRDWIAKRTQHGAYHGLVQDIRATDPSAYRNFVRMDEESFETLLQRLTPSIQRQDTILREAIPPEERLCLTLRYLATGTHYS